MPILDWMNEDQPFQEQNDSFPATFLVPIVKRQWGTVRVTAINEEEALDEFYNMLLTRVEAEAEWDTELEYEYDSCGSIERE